MGWNRYSLRRSVTSAVGSSAPIGSWGVDVPAFSMDYLSSLLYDEKGDVIAEPLGPYATPIPAGVALDVVGVVPSVFSGRPSAVLNLPYIVAGASEVPFKPLGSDVVTYDPVSGDYVMSDGSKAGDVVNAVVGDPAVQYVCPYDDGLVFQSLSEFKEHLAHVHFGERTPEEKALAAFEYEDKLLELRTKRNVQAGVPIDLNGDGKIDARDYALAARYGGWVDAASLLLQKSRGFERAVDVPGSGAVEDLPVIGDSDYADFVQRDGFPRKTGAVFGYPEPFGYEGDGKMAYYQRSYRRWAVVPPGTPGAIPSRFRPGQWVIRVR